MVRGEQHQGEQGMRKLFTAAPPKYLATGERVTRDNKNKNTRERKQQQKQTNKQTYDNDNTNTKDNNRPN
jgi:hypothetical protein